MLPLPALLLAALLLLPAMATAQSVSFGLPATTNLYGAGHAGPPDPNGTGGGTLPSAILIPGGAGRTLTFSGVTGSIDYGGCCPANGPDGVPASGVGASIDWDGLAGMSLARGRFLAAVFLDGTEPMDPPPAGLLIPGIDFATLSPGLRQVFFVGDGLDGTGSGSTQVFDVPDGATRLFLGFQDAGQPDNTVPGWYDDNTGSVTGTANFMAPAATPGLGLMGALGVTLAATALVLRAERRPGERRRAAARRS